MANFLFWNTNRRTDIGALVANACWEREIDVLILAEFEPSPVQFLEQLNHAGRQRTYLAPFEPSPRLKFFTRYPLDALQLVHDGGGIAARVVRPPVGVELLVVAVHLPSKLFRAPEEQALYTTRVSRKIGELEFRVGHSNTLLIGDLNMDPFESGMIAADGFHAVMDRSIASEISRTVDGRIASFSITPCGVGTAMKHTVRLELTTGGGKRGKTGGGTIIRFPLLRESDSLRACRRRMILIACRLPSWRI